MEAILNVFSFKILVRLTVCTKKPYGSVSITMTAKITQKFKLIEREPSPELTNRIVMTIEKIRIRNARIRFWFYGSLSTLSIIAIIPATIELGTQFGQTGFYQYLSLVFYDSSVLTSSGGELLRAIVESIPSLSVILVLSILVLFIWSMRKTITTRSLSTASVFAFNS